MLSSFSRVNSIPASTSSFVIGDQLSAGDSQSRSAVSRSDVFVRNNTSFNTPVRRVLASTAPANSNAEIDAAMTEVLPSLQQYSLSGDAIAESSLSDSSLAESSVDEVLKSEI